MSGYQNLISPRSRAPIVLSDEDDDDQGGFRSRAIVRSVPSSARSAFDQLIDPRRTRSQERTSANDNVFHQYAQPTYFQSRQGGRSTSVTMPTPQCSHKQLVGVHKRSASDPEGEFNKYSETATSMERQVFVTRKVNGWTNTVFSLDLI